MMHVYSPAAWSIASLYSSALASETRDLAGHIDAALDGARAEIERQRGEIGRLRAALLRIDGINDNPAHYNEEINAVVWKALRDEQSKDAKP